MRSKWLHFFQKKSYSLCSIKPFTGLGGGIFSLALQLHVLQFIRENDFKLNIFHGNKLKFRSEIEGFGSR